MIKRIFLLGVVLIFLALFLFPLSSLAGPKLTFNNICPGSSQPYCDDVGQWAYNAQGPPALRAVRLGKIVGVTWKKKGALIGVSEALPQHGIPAKYHLSPRDAFYYIIDEGSGYKFLRQCREIRPQP